jgi:DNA polymerase-4
MHIDLNSCFATIEKQANRLLRNRPVGVAAYDTPRGMILASCYLAKAKGVKLGVNVAEARQMCPGIAIMTPDPAKYREAHHRFGELLLDYTPDVTAKSIDEFVLNLTGSPFIAKGKTMQEIGLEIKQKIYEKLGEAVTVNIGIAPNRFLAKYAAGFNKPNGLTQIDSTNLVKHFTGMDLTDLPGINTRYKKRLQLMGVMNPLDMFNADPKYLQKRIFKSVVGVHWHMRMRGWEVDDREFKRKSIGHQYALSNKTSDKEELARLLMKLCEKIGRRLRSDNYYATGVHLYLAFVSESPDISGIHIGFENINRFRSWHKGHKLGYRLYSTADIYHAAKHLLSKAEVYDKVRLMAITVFGLEPWSPEQGNLFEGQVISSKEKGISGALDDSKEFKKYRVNKQLSDALDNINNRYGEFAITPGAMLDMKGTILDRIAFGSTADAMKE